MSFSNILAYLQPIHRHLLAEVANIAQQHMASTWLVGGVVRDMLLNVPVQHDLDLVVEGNAITLAHAIATRLHGNIVASHQPFGTATIWLPQEQLYLDLAMARTETYPSPAALPVVAPATIGQDLGRRDFSINAMAMEICAHEEGIANATCLDPFGGYHDLQHRCLRVLHDASFDDDPTRILRGLRLSARLDFQFDPHTSALLTTALEQQRLESTSVDRIRTELCLVLDEPEPDRVLWLADTLAIMPHIFPALHWHKSLANIKPTVPAGANHALYYAGWLTYYLSSSEINALLKRYRVPNDVVRVLQDSAAIQSLMESLSDANIANSSLDALLHRFNMVALEVVMYAMPGVVAQNIARYQQIHSIKPLLDGYALQQLGVAPGPNMGQMLRDLRAAKLDGIVATREEEEAWVLEAVKR